MGKNLKGDKKLIVLIVCVVVIILLAVGMFIKTNTKDTKKQISESEIKDILSKQGIQIVYIENSDAKKCKGCKKVKDYLDKKKLNYTIFDVAKHSDKEYDKLLQTLSINKSDFGYPAIIYLSSGIMYSNLINIDDTALIDKFIEEYKLNQVSTEIEKRESVK